MTMYLWLKLLAFGFAFLDTGVFVTGKYKYIYISLVIFFFFVAGHWFEIGKKNKLSVGTGNEEAHHKMVKAVVAQRDMALCDRIHCYCLKRHKCLGRKITT